MSYQIYYKWKVFKDDNNNIFVFSFSGSNNCCMVNRFTGRQLRERDWSLFFRGSLSQFQSYLARIDSYKDGFATSSNKGLTQEQLFKKIEKLSKTADNINNLKAFFYVECSKHEYNGQNNPLEIIDLYDFSEELYFSQNSKKEYLYLCDETTAQLRQKGY